MHHKVLTFRETLTGAARTLPHLLDSNGEVNTSAVARYCRDKGHPVSQPTIHRHYTGKGKRRSVDDKTAKALSAVFHIPARIWKGEPVTDNEARALSKASLETILIAQKLDELPEKARNTILNQIEDAHEAHEKLQRALADGNVTSITRPRS
jgi:hypothetical protein